MNEWIDSSIGQSSFMSVYISKYSNLPNVITVVLYKMALTFLQKVKSYPSFTNCSVAIGHFSSMWLTDRALEQMHVRTNVLILIWF